MKVNTVECEVFINRISRCLQMIGALMTSGDNTGEQWKTAGLTIAGIEGQDSVAECAATMLKKMQQLADNEECHCAAMAEGEHEMGCGRRIFSRAEWMVTQAMEDLAEAE